MELNPRTLARVSHLAGLAVSVAAGVFVVLWIGFIGQGMGFGTAIDDPKDFLIVMLNGITAAGLYFVVASGFTLIFGLMRVVNMAHGSFFLLGGYIALRVQRDLVGQGGAFGLSSSQVSVVNWVVPAIVGTVLVGFVGLAMQQTLLRWNQGQDLRQALITIAVSIILADQMLSHFGGIAEGITWPGRIDHFVDLRVAEVQYSEERLLILLLSLVIGAALWFWLKRTRTGMVIRAGVDDRAMVSALGINIQRTFAIAFFVGSALAGLGGVVGGSVRQPRAGRRLELAPELARRRDHRRHGIARGAAIGSLLLGLTTNLSAAYLPATYNYYSIVLTFVLLAIVLAVRPYGIYGRPA